MFNKVVKYYKEIFKNFKVVFLILGNHDYVNKEDNNYDSITPLFEDTKNVIIINGIEEIIFNKDFKVMMCSWVFDIPEFIDNIKNKSANLVLGHFELNDFEMNDEYLMKIGMDMSRLKKFEQVITAHYHKYQEKENVIYLGAITQLDWSDYNRRKYYGIYNIKNRKFHKIENKHRIFIKKLLSEITDEDIKQMKNRIVKLVIDTDDNYKKVVDKINDITPFKFKIEDNRRSIINADTEIDVDTDIPSMSNEFIKENVDDEGIDKNILFKKFNEIYQEAKSI